MGLSELRKITVERCMKCGKVRQHGKWILLQKDKEEQLDTFIVVSAICNEC